MATPFQVELVTPERVLFSGEAEEVSLRSDGGEISFLAHHEDYVAAVDITQVRIVVSSVEILAAVHGGFVEVNHNGVVILAGVAELSGEIDVARAERALAAAQDQSASGASATPEATVDGEAEHVGAMTGAEAALLAPESPESAARRARTRLLVAGVTATP